MAALTNDSFYDGRLNIKQAKSGYRFSLDAVVLARQAAIKPNDRVLDLGTGCGIIALMLAYLHPDITVYGVEIQKEQADIAVLNVNENFMADRIAIFHQDMKTITPSLTAGPVDVVICNPPHIAKPSGRINPDEQLAIARHEITITLDDLIKIASRMLNHAGRFILVYPAERLVETINKMHSARIEPKKLSMIYSKADTNAKRILLEGVKNGQPGIVITPPLIIHNADGSYTKTAQNMFNI
jgi:tRNA1Val (adenine37-N6)-methyltransferase